MYNLADEGVQFSPTQLFNQTRRGCSASNGQGVQLGRYIQSEFFRAAAKARKKRYFNRCICIYIFINIFVVFINYI